MTRPTVAIITGANRGIGEAIVRCLAADPPHVPLALYATSRKGASLDLKPAADVEVHYHKLDIADSASIRSLYDTIKSKYGGLDVLINNAGVNMNDKYNRETVKTTLDTNVRGTLQVSDTCFSSCSQIAEV